PNQNCQAYVCLWFAFPDLMTITPRGFRIDCGTGSGSLAGTAEMADPRAFYFSGPTASGASTGSPAFSQASNPPITLVTFSNPARCSMLHAIMLRYPLLQC